MNLEREDACITLFVNADPCRKEGRRLRSGAIGEVFAA